MIPTEALGKEGQAETLARLKKAHAANNVKCSMVTTETFHHAVWAASPAAEAPAVREYAKFRVQNTVDIGHELGASFAVYWPGSLGYYVQGAIDCQHDIAVAAKKGRPTLKHCLEAKPFEPQAEIPPCWLSSLRALIPQLRRTHAL